MDEAMLKSGQFPNVAIEAGTDPAEVMREHGREVIPDGEKYELDTREKLEADVGDVVTILRMAANGGFDGSTGNVMKNAKVLLDMPKERALDSEVFQAFADMVEWERDELTAERDALKEQINRFNAPKSEEIAENDTSKGVLNNFDVQNDSREKLEADAETLLFEFGHYCATSREGISDDVYVFIGDLTDLLDRQVAITAASFDCNACADDVLQRESALCAKVDELTADLDACKLREKAADDYDFREAAQRWEQAFEDKCGEVVRLTAERDQLSRDLDAEHALVVQFEHDNEELRHANNTLRASVAGLKSTVERFKARESGDTRQSG